MSKDRSPKRNIQKSTTVTSSIWRNTVNIMVSDTKKGK